MDAVLLPPAARHPQRAQIAAFFRRAVGAAYLAVDTMQRMGFAPFEITHQVGVHQPCGLEPEAAVRIEVHADADAAQALRDLLIHVNFSVGGILCDPTVVYIRGPVVTTEIARAA